MTSLLLVNVNCRNKNNLRNWVKEGLQNPMRQPGTA